MSEERAQVNQAGMNKKRDQSIQRVKRVGAWFQVA